MTRRNRDGRVLCAALVLSILLASCGQKPGVHVATSSGDFSSQAGSEPGVTGEAATDGNGAEGGGGGGAPTGSGAKGPAGSTTTTGKVDRTGVGDSEIVIGVHAPVTGAAPFPAESFRRALDVYWKRPNAPKVNGRSVRVVFENDNYEPFTAVDRCRKMAEQDKVFALVGGGGTDQVQACAKWASSKGIPYMSAGVTEVGLRNLRNYFALSMSYKQQAPYLWDFIQKNPLGLANWDPARVAMVRTNTPNFEDAHSAFLQAAQASGRTLVLDRRLSKNPSETELDDTARALSARAASIVFILTAPVHYVQLTAATRLGSYRPWWVGVGITQGLNDVLGTGCRTSANAIANGLFFSPFPGVDSADSVDAAYRPAYQAKNPGFAADDLGLAFWALNKTLHKLLETAGKDLSRQGFIASTERASVESGIFPALKFGPQNHFGASTLHLLRANCDTRQYATVPPLFRSGF